MSSDRAVPCIQSIYPPAAITGGEFEVRGTGFVNNGQRLRAWLGSASARLVVGAKEYAVIQVPAEATEGNLVLGSGEGESKPYRCSVGQIIAENLHPVAGPAVDSAGHIYTTRSGSRGEKVPVSVFCIDLNGDVKPFNSDIINPTGLAVNRQDEILVSSRNNGTIYKLSATGQMEIYAEGMGVATGIAFDAEGNLFVGDRTGTIFKISPSRQIYVFATLEPSVAAYHLAVGPEGLLYVTGPTTSSFDAVYRVSQKGDVEVYFQGFGRPQGLMFDAAGNLYVAASHCGRRGVFRITPGKEVDQVVSGPSIVGMARLPNRELALATSSELYRIDASSWLDQ